MRACSLFHEGGDCLVSKMAFEAVPALDFATPALKFEFHEGPQATEEVVVDGLFAAHKEPLGMADLFEGAVVALDRPVFLAGMIEEVPSHFHAPFFRVSKTS